MPVTSAAGMMVPAITWYGEAGNCRLSALRVAVSPAFAGKASLRSCRFCAAVGSVGEATAGLIAPKGLNGC
jgi:hypothetical protein